MGAGQTGAGVSLLLELAFDFDSAGEVSVDVCFGRVGSAAREGFARDAT